MDKNIKTVEKINLADRTIYWFKNHAAMLQSGAIALCLSVTLFGCASNSNDEAEVVNNETTELSASDDVTVEGIANEAATGVVNGDEASSLAERRSAVITSINLATSEAEKLKDMADSVKGTPEMDAAVQQTVAEFDALYRFIIKGEQYNGMYFNELTDANDKLEVIDSTMSLGEIIATVEPNYKDEVKQKYEDIKESFKNSEFKAHVDSLIDKYGPKVEDKAVELAAKGYNWASDMGDKIKEEASNQRGQR